MSGEILDLPYLRTRLIFFGVHAALILGVCCADTLDFIGDGSTFLPKGLERFAQTGQTFLSAVIGPQARAWNPIAPELRAYLNGAGINAGYSFFAPQVPNSYKLVFELHYPDERVEYDAIGGETDEARLRISSVLDQLGRTDSDQLREAMMKLLTHSVWQFHPEAVRLRAILGTLRTPSVREFKSGQRNSDELLYAYDFVFAENTSR